MSIAEYAQVPPAWYEDQSDPSQLRWWDGLDWTDFVRPRLEAAPEPVAETVIPRVGANGLASAEQLAAWPPPALDQGFFGPTAAPEHHETAVASQPLTRRQLRELVGPLTTP